MDDRCESEGCDMITTYEDENEWQGVCSRCGAESYEDFNLCTWCGDRAEECACDEA